MKQHKNDLNPGPLTESGYSGRSCYQANLPDNNRASVELPVEGHQRLKSIPLRGSPGIEQVKADGDSHIGLKHRTKAQTGNPGIVHLYQQVKSPGFLHCHHVNEFRRRIASEETGPVRPEMEVLYTNSTDKIPIKLPGFLQCLDVKEFRRRTKFLETDLVGTELEVFYAYSAYKIPIKLPGFFQCLDVKEFRRRTASQETDPERTELEVLNAKSTNLIPIKFPGFIRCFDESKFRRRTVFMEIILAKKQLETHNINSSDNIPNGRIVDIFPDKALRPPGRNVFSFGRLISHVTRKVKSRLKTCFRWRKIMSLPELVFPLKKLEFLWRRTKSLSCLVISLIEPEFTCEAKNKIFEASKLRLCQS
jgi:hypothetical protein